jgi:hypothetical protein
MAGTSLATATGFALLLPNLLNRTAVWVGASPHYWVGASPHY